MMAPWSFIGFALAALMAGWCASILLGVVAWLARRRSAAAGPAVERAIAAGVIAGAPSFGLLMLVALVVQSLSAIAGGADHCAAHGHHPHLCLVHGGAWVDEPWAVVVLTMFGAYLAVRLLQGAVAWMRGQRATRRLACASRAEGAALVAPADTSFCFVSGLHSPRIFVSSAAWEALDADERRSVVAHEQAHIAQRDLWWRAALGALALLGVPWVTAPMIGAWTRATERLCDARAARVMGVDPVARALVKMARLGANRALSAGLAFGARQDIVTRVEALLGDLPTGTRVSRRVSRLAVAGFFLGGAAAIALADPLHHALETILGVL